MKNLFIVFFFAFAVIIGMAQAQLSTYDVSGFTGSFDLTETGLTMNYTDVCNVQMASTNTFITDVGSFDSAITWRSPDTNVLGFSTLTGLSNTSCLSYGRTAFINAGTDPTSTFYESSYLVSQAADSGFVTTETRYVCDVPTDTINFEIGRGLDSRGDCQYRRRAATGLNSISWINALNTNYNRCGDLSTWIDIACNSSFASGGANDVTIQYIYPFNSSATGTVGYNFSTSTFSAGSTVTPSMYVDIIDTVSQTNTTIQSEVGILQASRTFAAFSGVSSLASDRTHLFVITYQIIDNGLAFASTINPPIINLSIFTFRPDYLCGEFGECTNSSQSRVCVDQLGVAPDRIETRSCFDVPFFENLLGFEQFTNGNVYTCQKFWFLGCLDFLNVTTARFPVNWTVSGDVDFLGFTRQNYLTVSPDTSTEGSRSLKMWYIPPKPEEPISDPANASLTVCGNKSVGDFPETTTGFNDTLFLSTNITFPAPFIDLRFDVRRCTEPVVQYDYTGDLLELNCGKRCYAFDCNQTPNGRYGIRLVDIDTSQIIVDFTGTATPDWRSFIIDLSNSGLLTDHNYTLSLAVNPENQFDAFTHCLYFDNIRASLRSSAVTSCDTVCDGLNLLLATQQGNSCIFTTITNSPGCAPDSETATSFENFEEVCIDETLHFFNNETGLWDSIEDSVLCESITVSTEQETNITSPLGDTQDYIEFFDFLFSPIFIYIIFSLIISGVLSAGIARITDNGDGVFQVFGVTMMIFVLLGSLPGIAVIPIWVSVAVIAVISLLIAQKLRNFGVPGGGG